MKSGVLPILGALLLLPCGLHADHADFVVVSATASKNYTQRKFVNGSPKPESYVFFEGKYFNGDVNDPSIDHASFMDIAKVLAPNLAKQNFFPTRDAKSADLLIVVNWGTTITDYGGKNDMETQDLLKDAQSAAASGDINELTFDLMQNQTQAASAQKFAEFNAGLLGYTTALTKEMSMQWASPDGLNAEAESHLSDLIEQRYFVILLAYDYQKILSDGKAADAQMNIPRGRHSLGAVRDDPTQPRPVWEVRMNITARGNNFVEALPAMSKVAADYFGKQFDDLKTEETDVGKNASVEIGPVKTLEIIK
jgi:hypothetical protein